MEMQLVYGFTFRNLEAPYVIMLTYIKCSCVFTTHIYGLNIVHSLHCCRIVADRKYNVVPNLARI